MVRAINATRFSGFYKITIENSDLSPLLKQPGMPTVVRATTSAVPDSVFVYCLQEDEARFRRGLEGIKYERFPAEGVDGVVTTANEAKNALERWMDTFIPTDRLTKGLWI